MTDHDSEVVEPRARGLLIAGIAMIALGVVGAFFAYRGAESAATTGEFSAALSGQLVDVAPDLTFMWVFIVVAALGVVALIVRAATTR